MNRAFIEAASWWLVSELHRRHPNRFRVIETHPGGGMYDCLSLIDPRDINMADFNREGSFHVHRRFDDDSETTKPLPVWQEMAGAWQPVSVLDRICDMLGLSIPAHRPSSTPTTLVYRLIATFLSHSVFDTPNWECRNGMEDTSGYGGGVITAFERFPGAAARLQVRLPNDLLHQPGYRFWFLLRQGKAQLCLETTGTVWNDRGESYQLSDLYQEVGRRIWPMIWRFGGDLFP